MVEARGAEVLIDNLQRMAEGFGNSLSEAGTVRHRP